MKRYNEIHPTATTPLDTICTAIQKQTANTHWLVGRQVKGQQQQQLLPLSHNLLPLPCQHMEAAVLSGNGAINALFRPNVSANPITTKTKRPQRQGGGNNIV